MSQSKYIKEHTVSVSLGNTVRISEILDELENRHGIDAVLAVVPKTTPGMYEITFSDQVVADNYCASMPFKGNEYTSRVVGDNTKVVSLMYLPSYMTDEYIVEKLTSMGLTVMSEIKRHFIRRDSGPNIADGTRYVRCKFPDHIIALPSSIKMETADGSEYFKIRHNNQKPVCSLCLSDSHRYRQCPEFKCFRCGGQGHRVNECTVPQCHYCRRPDSLCECQSNYDADYPTFAEHQSNEYNTRPKKSAKRSAKSDNKSTTMYADVTTGKRRSRQSNLMEKETAPKPAQAAATNINVVIPDAFDWKVDNSKVDQEVVATDTDTDNTESTKVESVPKTHDSTEESRGYNEFGDYKTTECQANTTNEDFSVESVDMSHDICEVDMESGIIPESQGDPTCAKINQSSDSEITAVVNLPLPNSMDI